ncbi:DNA-3-methyladenine glycosylase family protein [Clostridium fallax]|uniref:DNA-(apurinic or apyrimidinic site) lyase n=1 Tax=Clostridium fallax TaxID=1533 RepID=A0A1M4Z4B3_9CLOT|nr:DNA glycosylase [Clostridium fallax]SHF12627.1 N-glycosylase/DNA lyase [Clostridium fallax]SQB22301.1 8-oxoguanine DNA glycosylase [Clostridium fallax]
MDFKNIEYFEDRVVLKGTKNFNIKQTFECGQCFRWKRQENGNYIGVALGKVIELEQNDDEITLYNTNKEDFNNIWIDYFDLKRDYSSIKEELSKDELLKKAVEYGYGIRILKQEPFEILISFIISARNSIPVISKTINKISEKWGTKIAYKGKEYYTFPAVEDFHKATLDEIKDTGASFRSKYILDTVDKVYSCNNLLKDIKDIKDLNDNQNELLKYNLLKICDMNDDDCHKALQEFMGVGAKVSDCIMLFSMRKYSAFPVDVWVKRAMEHFYLAPDVSLNKIRVFGREKFGELSGFAQQYLFYYARENNIKL